MSKNHPFVKICGMMLKQRTYKEVDCVDVAERIIKLNEKRGWSVYRLAKEAHISSSTLTNMLRRGTSPSLMTLERLCEAYGITLAEFLYDQEDLIHLNESQKRHLNRWNLLTERQQRAVELFIDGLKQIG